jgi:membrane-bound lytic murein transglycosylase F
MLIASCSEVIDDPEYHAAAFQRDLAEIKKEGKLILLTENTSTSYYVYKGQPIGYDFELVKDFAESLGLELEVKVIRDMNRMFEMLNNGEGDLIACNLTVTRERKKSMSFTNPLLQTRQVLVQRRPDDWSELPKRKVESQMIRDVRDLSGVAVHVHEYSSFHSRLKNIQDEIGDSIYIVPAPGDIDSEGLIRMVANGEIEYTVADENMAMLNSTYFQNIDVSTPISFPQDISWAVRQNSDTLLMALNGWIQSPEINRKMAFAFKKYLESPKTQLERAQGEFSSLAGTGISRYDESIKKESQRLGWDWRLLAAMIYHESRFDPEAVSWAGAFGLMQLMPGTAERFGIDSTHREMTNIHAGVSYLMYLEKFWENRVEDLDERRKFILASYNAGHGHVLDAQKLARELSLNDQKWDRNVEMALALKSEPKFYTMACVNHGYCRGPEVTKYVRNILNNYQHYLSLDV